MAYDIVDHATTQEEVLTRVRVLVETKVAREISDLLHLDTKTLDRFIADLLSDRIVWGGLAGVIWGLTNQNTQAVAAALGTLAVAGPRAFKALHDRKGKLVRSDYQLIYTVAKRDW